MAKIAATPLARGEGWSVSDLVCTAGPSDRPFEERHACASVAVVAGGTFQYRGHAGRALMMPGSLLLGSPGQAFECGHEHGVGDRCVSFSYSAGFFDRLAFEAGGRAAAGGFRGLRLPPVRALSPLVASVDAAVKGGADARWEEFAIDLAARAVQIDRGLAEHSGSPTAAALARVTRVVRMMERGAQGPCTLAGLAREARLSPYHFLRTFECLTGVTPHQYLLRLRLRRAAVRLSTEAAPILNIALDCGFGDVSNFNRMFRAEFGLAPRAYRARAGS